MRETWDLEIEGTHSFVAEGIVTHNTEVALALWRCLGVPALHIVHRKDLLIQTVDRARVRLPNAPISAIGDGRVDAGAWRREGYVVGTVQTLLRLIEQDPRILQGVGLILLDECHSTGSSNRWSKVANLCPAFYRFGLSGTPYTGDPIRDLTLEGVTGPPLMRVASADLIAQGVSVRPIVEIHYVDGPPFVGGWSEARRTVIEGNLRRNGLIIRIAKQESAKGRRTLILCNTVRHVRIIEQAARSAGLEIAVAIGRHRSAHRSAVLRDLKLGLHTVVLSTLFSEGTDVPELDTLILAGSGKSPIRLLQRIGRALRSSPHKKFARVVDFWDSQSTITERHSKARLALCEREGFEVRVVESS
jgi:superfamily II DNA or RNA helicase